MNSLLSDLLKGIDLAKEDIDPFIVALFTCKDVNRVPWETFSLLKMIFEDVLGIDKNDAEIIAIIVAQGLSVVNQLVINVNDKELTEDDLIIASQKREVTFEDIKKNLVKNYKLHWISNKKKEDFLKAIGSITSDQDILTSAASFIHYHCVNDITDENVIHRDLALANLLRLCNINKLYKEFKTILKNELDITEEVLKTFVTENIDTIFGG